MPFKPIARVVTASSLGIQLIDATGAYDVNNNPGGWGTPNPIQANVTAILILQALLGKSQSLPQQLSSDDMAAYLTGQGVTIGPVGKDGVYDIDALLGFACPSTLSAAAGAYQFTMTNASTLFVAAIGFTIDSISSTTLYLIDRTKPLTSVGGFVTSPLPAAAGLSVTYYFDAQVYALISTLGTNCLNQDIAKFAGTCDCGCEGEELNALLCRYAQYLSMNQRFVEEDWPGANNLAINAMNKCYKSGPCAPLQGAAGSELPCIAPVITTQPGSQTVAAGGNVVFTVAATGTIQLNYQWQKNGVDIPGQVGQSLSLFNVQTSNNNDQYTVIVYNNCGRTTSTTAVLTISSAAQGVAITTQPQSQSVATGANVTFSVVATGTAPITYQWQKNGTNITGETGSNLNLSNVQSGDVAAYTVIVSNGVNSVTSNAAALSIGNASNWGWLATPPVTTGDLAALQGSGTFPHNGTITADFRANSTPLYLVMSEDVGEQVKLSWFGAIDNQGAIGSVLFNAPITIGSRRVYVTMFPTFQTLTTIQFLTT